MANSKGEKVIMFTEGWTFIQECFNKVLNQLEGGSAQVVNAYPLVYEMCTQNEPYNFSGQLYEKYKESLHEYINSKVLPTVRRKQGELMLKELAKRWGDYKVVVGWFSRTFGYLDRYYLPKIAIFSQPPRTVASTGVKCFRDLVYAEMKVDVKNAVIAMINREREGKHIDRALLKSVVGIFVEVRMGQMEAYETDFETFMLQDTAAIYRRITSSWTKAEECLNQEKERVGHYLHPSTEPKLLETVEKELATLTLTSNGSMK